MSSLSLLNFEHFIRKDHDYEKVFKIFWIYSTSTPGMQKKKYVCNLCNSRLVQQLCLLCQANFGTRNCNHYKLRTRMSSALLSCCHLCRLFWKSLSHQRIIAALSRVCFRPPSYMHICEWVCVLLTNRLQIFCPLYALIIYC